MSKQEQHHAPTARDIFSGINGRPPKTDDELQKWLASDVGKAAMAFEPAPAERWGQVGRS
jgi:hypothetical protein